MRLYNHYILSLTGLLLATAVGLIAAGQTSLSAFYTAYVIEAFVLTELYIYFNVRARHSLAFIGVILFAGFMVMIYLEILHLLLR